jgi:hypothetical protein
MFIGSYPKSLTWGSIQTFLRLQAAANSADILNQEKIKVEDFHRPFENVRSPLKTWTSSQRVAWLDDAFSVRHLERSKSRCPEHRADELHAHFRKHHPKYQVKIVTPSHFRYFLMNPTQANYWERSQQTIDAEIKSFEESIRALEESIRASVRALEESIRASKTRRNALSPISSLPPEVFAAIFSFACLPGIPSLGAKPVHNLAPIHVSHVCH